LEEAVSIMTTVLFNCVSNHLRVTIPLITESKKPELVEQLVDFMWAPVKQEILQQLTEEI